MYWLYCLNQAKSELLFFWGKLNNGYMVLFSKPLYYSQPSRRKLPRLKLIFWRFKINIWIMAVFIIILILNFTHIIWRLVQTISVSIIIFLCLLGLAALTLIAGVELFAICWFWFRLCQSFFLLFQALLKRSELLKHWKAIVLGF